MSSGRGQMRLGRSAPATLLVLLATGCAQLPGEGFGRPGPFGDLARSRPAPRSSPEPSPSVLRTGPDFSRTTLSWAEPTSVAPWLFRSRLTPWLPGCHYAAPDGGVEVVLTGRLAGFDTDRTGPVDHGAPASGVPVVGVLFPEHDAVGPGGRRMVDTAWEVGAYVCRPRLALPGLGGVR